MLGPTMMHFEIRSSGGSDMNHNAVLPDRSLGVYGPRRAPILLFMFLMIGVGIAPAQNEGPQPASTAPFSVRATHLLGFEGSSRNANGDLSIQGHELQFQKKGKPPAQLDTASIHDVLLGEQ